MMQRLINLFLGRRIYTPSTIGSVQIHFDSGDQLGVINVVRVVSSPYWVEVATTSSILKFPREGVVFMSMIEGNPPEWDEEPRREYLH